MSAYEQVAAAIKVYQIAYHSDFHSLVCPLFEYLMSRNQDGSPVVKNGKNSIIIVMMNRAYAREWKYIN